MRAFLPNGSLREMLHTSLRTPLALMQAQIELFSVEHSDVQPDTAELLKSFAGTDGKNVADDQNSA